MCGRWHGRKGQLGQLGEQAQEAIVELAGGQLGDPARLLPYAMVFPGPQHIIDGVAKEGVGWLAYWEEWLTAAKLVCQWLRQVNHRR